MRVASKRRYTSTLLALTLPPILLPLQPWTTPHSTVQRQSLSYYGNELKSCLGEKQRENRKRKREREMGGKNPVLFKGISPRSNEFCLKACGCAS